MEYVFRVVKTVDLDPEDTSHLVSLSGFNTEEKQRIHNYIAIRSSDFKFKWRREYLYRFYVLEKVCKLNPPAVRTPNLQGFYYCTEDELGVRL